MAVAGFCSGRRNGLPATGKHLAYYAKLKAKEMEELRMTIGWGVVSTGRAADVLVGPAINAAEGSKIVAVFSRDQARADEYAAKHDGAKAYASYEQMLADPAVEVVSIASPTSLHYEQVVAAAKAGKHVYCDKPLAMSPDEART